MLSSIVYRNCIRRVKKEKLENNNNKKAPVSGGRKEGLRIPADGDIVLDEAGLAGANRPFLMMRFEDRSLDASAIARSLL